VVGRERWSGWRSPRPAGRRSRNDRRLLARLTEPSSLLRAAPSLRSAGWTCWLGRRSRLRKGKRLKSRDRRCHRDGNFRGSRGRGPLCDFRRSRCVQHPATRSPQIATSRRSQCGDGFTGPAFCRASERFETQSPEGTFTSTPQVMSRARARRWIGDQALNPARSP
jgi:hypothetical protein